MTPGNREPALCCKVVMIGNSGVGKTSLTNRWINGSFCADVEPTIGANHLSKRVSVEGHDISIFMWDTAGQEQFKSLAPVYTRSASAVILVVSTTDIDSINAIDYWINVICETNDVLPPFILAINKVDLNSMTNEMEDYISQKKSQFDSIFLVSAATGEAVESLFASSAHAAYHFLTDHTVNAIEIHNKKPKQKSCC